MESLTTDKLSNDMEMLKKMEDEHLRLQRQVRMIQIDRQNRTMGVHPQFRRQDTLLRKLKKDYIDFVKDLKIARSGAHKKKDKRMKEDLKWALLLRTRTEQDAEAGITLMKQLDDLLRVEKKDMLLLKKLEIASQGEMAQRRTLSERRLISTENQLETATLRFNVLQAENRKIREEIEHMLKDRALFNQSWNKMLTALNKGKKFLSELFEASTLAYDQRDEWCGKLRSIQEKGKMDQMIQVLEMRELQKAFDHEMKLYHFLSAKGVMRLNKQQEEREEQERLKELENIQKQYDAHTRILEDISDYTNETDPKKIKHAFNQIEQQNFSIYLLMTEYCAENQVLMRQVAKIRQDVDDRRDWNDMEEAKRQNTLEHLREELEKKQTKNEELRSTLDERTQLLNRTMERVVEIFNVFELSLEPFENLLGDKQPSLWHFNLTMRLIMEKIQDYIEIAYYYERHVYKRPLVKRAGGLKKYLMECELPHTLTPLPINLMVPAETCPRRSSSRRITIETYAHELVPIRTSWSACISVLIRPEEDLRTRLKHGGLFTCVEARWLSRVSETLEAPLTKEETLKALRDLRTDPAFVWSDRVHPLTECKVPRSRAILAMRYMQHL